MNTIYNATESYVYVALQRKVFLDEQFWDTVLIAMKRIGVLLNHPYFDAEKGNMVVMVPQKSVDMFIREVYPRLQTAVSDEFSVGIARNPALALVASNWSEFDGIIHITPSEESLYLQELPISDVPMLSARDVTRLRKLQIFTAYDLATAHRDFLESMTHKIVLDCADELAGRRSYSSYEYSLPTISFDGSNEQSSIKKSRSIIQKVEIPNLFNWDIQYT